MYFVYILYFSFCRICLIFEILLLFFRDQEHRGTIFVSPRAPILLVPALLLLIHCVVTYVKLNMRHSKNYSRKLGTFGALCALKRASREKTCCCSAVDIPVPRYPNYHALIPPIFDNSIAKSTLSRLVIRFFPTLLAFLTPIFFYFSCGLQIQQNSVLLFCSWFHLFKMKHGDVAMVKQIVSSVAAALPDVR